MGRRAHQWLELGLAVRRLTARCNGRRLRAAAEREVVGRTRDELQWLRDILVEHFLVWLGLAGC
jgi:hypothetical protein